MQIASRQIFAHLSRSRLPYDAEIEYLESTGTQWIDTGVQPAGASVTIDCVCTGDYSTTQIIVGCGGGGGNWFGNVNGYFGVGGRVEHRCGSSSVRARILVEYLNGSVRATNLASGEIGNIVTPTLVSRGIGLFASSIPSYFARARAYSAEIRIGSVPARDLIPVRVGTEGCLYDRRGTGGMNPDGSARDDGMYYNRGTGAFVLGPDKS